MNNKLTESSIVSLNPLFRLQYEEAQEAWVLLYQEGMVKLNQSAAQIMQRCDGKKNINDIVSELETTFETEVSVNDVTGFVDVSLQQNWLTLASEQ